MSINFRPPMQRTALRCVRATKLALLTFFVCGSASYAQSDVFIVRCGRIETGTGEVFERGAILVENGVIKAVGYDFEAPLGAREIDARRFHVVPGFVHPTSALGQDRQRSAGNQAEQRGHDSFYPYTTVFRDALKEGFTTLALQPAGPGWSGLGGLSSVVQPTGGDGKSEPGAEIKERDVQLVLTMQTQGGDKDLLRKGFEKVEEAIQKLDEAQKKWDEKQKKAKEKEKKDEGKKEEEKKEGEGSKEEPKKDEPKKEEAKKEEKKEDVFEPPKVDDKTSTLWGWIKGEYPALVRLGRAADYLHWVDLIKDRKLRVAFEIDGSDSYQVADRIGKAAALVLLDPQITTYPLTSERLNLPAYFDGAGARVGFTPTRSFEAYRIAVADVVKYGFPREKAIAAMTSIPAEALGIDAHYGSIQVDRFADLLFFEGDPFEIGSKLHSVMIRGEMKFESEKEAQ